MAQTGTLLWPLAVARLSNASQTDWRTGGTSVSFETFGRAFTVYLTTLRPQTHQERLCKMDRLTCGKGSVP